MIIRKPEYRTWHLFFFAFVGALWNMAQGFQLSVIWMSTLVQGAAWAIGLYLVLLFTLANFFEKAPGRPSKEKRRKKDEGGFRA